MWGKWRSECECDIAGCVGEAGEFVWEDGKWEGEWDAGSTGWEAGLGEGEDSASAEVRGRGR